MTILQETISAIMNGIYTTINFTRLSVTTEVDALYGRHICSWLGMVWAWSSARGWLGVAGSEWSLHESRPELETVNK